MSLRLRSFALLAACVVALGTPVQATGPAQSSAEIISDVSPPFPGESSVQVSINLSVPDTGGLGFMQAGNATYFAGRDAANGAELWRMDATGSAALVRDLVPGGYPSNPQPFAASGNDVLFQRDNRIWRSDGTVNGTRQVFDPGSNSMLLRADTTSQRQVYFVARRSTPSATTSSLEIHAANVADLAPQLLRSFSEAVLVGSAWIHRPTLGSTFYFFARETSGGPLALWATAGTASGTLQLTTFASTPYGPFQRPFAVFVSPSRIFFLAEAQTSTELWVSSGSIASTTKVADYSPPSMSITQTGFAGETLFFSNFSTPYYSDGTAARTGTTETQSSQLARIGDQVFSTSSVSDPMGTRYDLVVGDTTGNNLQALRRFNQVSQFFAFNNLLLFFAYDTNNVQGVWRTDGTVAGTFRLSDIAVPWYGSMRRLADRVYFAAIVGDKRALYATDGSVAGTVEVKEVFAESLQVVGDRLLFVAQDSVLWQSDGTPTGTNPVANRTPSISGSSPRSMVGVGNLTYFIANSPEGRGIYRTDGTVAGTTLVAVPKDDRGRVLRIATYPNLPENELFVVGNKVFFVVMEEYGNELWVTDGTAAGTKRVFEPNGMLEASRPDHMIVFQGALYTKAYNKLYRTDGTAAGTTLVAAPVGTIRDIEVVGTKMLISVADGGEPDGSRNNGELWVSDGTPAGTAQLRRFVSGGRYWTGETPGTQQPKCLNAIGNRLFFNADGQQGTELWTSDGTVAGTIQIADIFTGTTTYTGTGEFAYVNTFPNSSNPCNIVSLGGDVYFTAQSRATTPTAPVFEVWRTDGTAAGTRLAFEVPTPTDVGANSWYDRCFQAINDTLYFTLNLDSVWRWYRYQPGMAAPVRLIPADGRDVSIGAPDTGPLCNLTAGPRGTVVFAGYTPESGLEYWQSDGTVAGSRLIADIAPGPGASVPYFAAYTDADLNYWGGLPLRVGDDIYVAASDGVRGFEPWKLTIRRTYTMNLPTLRR